MARARVRLLFLIRQLGFGGAERQLLNLVSGLDPTVFEVHVATMYRGGGLVPSFEAVPHLSLHSLDKAGRWDLRAFLSRLSRLSRMVRPDIVHGYMGGANELALVAARAVGARCIWGIRVSDLRGGEYTWSVGALFRAGALLSRFVDLQIANSERGRAYHLASGYRPNNFIVIPNGIDSERFRPRPSARAGWRIAHGIPLDRPMLLMPARLDPMKDHETFFRALADIARNEDFVAVCLGGGPLAVRAEYVARVASMGLGDRVLLPDASADVVDAYAASDLVVLSSAYGEGFPNVVGEAMACGRICIATDVGDAAAVIDDPSRVVAPGDSSALAATIVSALRMPAAERASLEHAARERIVANFSIPQLVERTSQAMLQLVR